MDPIYGSAALADRLSLPDAIRRSLRQQILAGELSPGQALRQDELARRFGVSRVPLREAMSRLEAEGLIVLRPHRGYLVTSLDRDEIMEMFELRMAVEEHAGYVATRVRSAADIAEVAAFLRRMEALDPANGDYLAQWARLNQAFHQRLFASSGRRHVVHIADRLRDAVEPYIRMEARMTGQFHEAQMEHRELFVAFEAGYASIVGQLSRQHCQSTLDRLLKSLPMRTSADGAP
jgi:DNA-binding GntR family transcriptional regulator